MTPTAPPARGLARIFAWPRVRFTLAVALVFGLLISIGSKTTSLVWIERAFVVASCALLAFGVFEQWPPRPPRWIMVLEPSLRVRATGGPRARLAMVALLALATLLTTFGIACATAAMWL